jgi:plasmid replication initiation protein
MENNVISPPFLGDSENIFVQANHFIQARYKEPLSYWESVIFGKMCSLIGPMDTDFKDYRVYIKDLIHLLDVTKTGRVYEDFIEAANRLRSREIVIKYPDENGKEMILDTALITGVARLNDPDKRDEIFVDLNIHPKLVPFLLELKTDFTLLDLRDYKHLHSGSTIRLYQILKSFWGRGNTAPEIEIEQLKGMLGVAGKYALYSNFKARVLEDTRRRLLDGARLAFNYEEKKETGRGGGRVVAVHFHLFLNTPKHAENDMSDEMQQQNTLLLPESRLKYAQETDLKDDSNANNCADMPDELTAKIMAFGVKTKQLKQLKETYSVAEMQKAALITEGVIANKKLKTSAAGFFVSALKDHYEANISVKTSEKSAEKGVKKAKNTENIAANSTQTSLKLSPEEQAKADKMAQRAAETRLQFEREKAIMEQLIEEDIELVHDAVTEIRRGMFGFAYSEDKTFAENRENKVFEAAFLNTIKKMRGDLFK